MLLGPGDVLNVILVNTHRELVTLECWGQRGPGNEARFPALNIKMADLEGTPLHAAADLQSGNLISVKP